MAAVLLFFGKKMNVTVVVNITHVTSGDAEIAILSAGLRCDSDLFPSAALGKVRSL